MAVVLIVIFINKTQPNIVVCAGRQYDDFGSAYIWWSTETNAKFQELAQCFVDQYSRFTVPELNRTVSKPSICMQYSWHCSSETCKFSGVCVAGERPIDAAGKHCWQWRYQGGLQGLQEAEGEARIGCRVAQTAWPGAVLTGPAFLHRLRHGSVLYWEPTVDSHFVFVQTTHWLQWAAAAWLTSAVLFNSW